MLSANPERVDLGVLSQFPEFQEFRRASGARKWTAPSSATASRPDVEETATPEERIEAAYQELREALIEELRERIAVVSPAAFEDMVLDVLHAIPMHRLTLTACRLV